MKHKPLTKNASIFLIGLTVAVILIASLIAYVIAKRVEVETELVVDQAIPIQDMGWVRRDVDGMRVTISGKAPSDEARFRVTEAVRTEINEERLINNITAPSIDLEEPELTVEIVQNSHMSSIMGLLPKVPSPLPLYFALDNANPEITTLNMVQDLESKVDDGWSEKIDYLAYVVKELPNVKISSTEDTVIIESVVPDEETLETVSVDLRANAPRGFEVVLNITAPRPLIAPFIFSEETNGDEVKVLACSATDEADLERIQSAMANVATDDFAACQLGLGAPTDDWGLLVAQLLSEVDTLDKHKLTIKDNQVALSYSDQEDPEVVEAVSSRIRSSLPPGFGFDTTRVVTVKSLDELEAEGNAVVFVIEKPLRGDAKLRGVLGSEAQVNNIDSFAVAKFGSGGFTKDVEIVSDLPVSWEKNVFAAINAVSELNAGSGTLTEAYLALDGSINSAEKKAGIMDVLSTELGTLTIQDNIVVNEAVADVEPTDPNECVRKISAILEKNPIAFEPSSTRIAADSQNTITEIAQLLYECRDHAFEISGHTDSKGGEDVNQRISQDRAQAVLDAILAQALEYGELNAKGYGETEPVATNDTEEGRARNRRIEIRVATPVEN